MGRPFGIPKTGVFGLYDLIGIDLMSDVAASLRSILPADDAFHAVGDDPALNKAMIAAGYTGNKGKVVSIATQRLGVKCGSLNREAMA